MSTRGINFLDRWIADNVPETTKADVISIDELTYKLIADAKALGIISKVFSGFGSQGRVWFVPRR
ncbi:DUF768 domain-containing protein [Mesorhizobium japonicum]|nr:DUF768 domain-containing protein [Mesorhizobium japonicum]